LPQPGICCCSFRRNRLTCPLHVDCEAAPKGKRSRLAKQNFHCKPYKQKLKGEFKCLKLDLKKIRIGSKPYTRRYGNKPMPPPVPKASKRAKEISLSHLWLGEVASKKQLAAFVQGAIRYVSSTIRIHWTKLCTLAVQASPCQRERWMRSQTETPTAKYTRTSQQANSSYARIVLRDSRPADQLRDSRPAGPKEEAEGFVHSTNRGGCIDCGQQQKMHALDATADLSTDNKRWCTATLLHSICDAHSSVWRTIIIRRVLII